MNSEKVKEIKKALEVYGKENKGITILRGGGIQAIPYTDILTLINELESENERLLEQRNKTYNIWVKDTEKLKDRIAELEMENKTKTDTITDLLKKQEFYEKEKLTKFAERLKEKFDEKKHFLVAVSSVHKHIDETLKEHKNEK